MESDNGEGVALTDDADSSSMELSIIETSTNVQDDTVNYQTADEENSSKYFSMIVGDSTLEASRDTDLSSSAKSCLDTTFTSPPAEKSIRDAGQSAKTENLLNSLSHISIEAVNKLHIHERIDAANILSGGVDIFDDYENSVDEHDLVIDDDPRPEKSEDCPEIVPDVSIDSKLDQENQAEPNLDLKVVQAASPNVIDELDLSTENNRIEKAEETIPKQTVEEVTYSNVLEGNLPPGSCEMMLVINGKDVQVVHIGEGVYIYKTPEGAFTAMQITLSEDDHPNVKPLLVGKNDDGSLEVYEEQVKQVAVTNEELEPLKTNELTENAEKNPPEDVSDTSNYKAVVWNSVSKIQLIIDKDAASVHTAVTDETHAKESQDAVSIEKECLNDLIVGNIKTDQISKIINQPEIEINEPVKDVPGSLGVVIKDAVEIKENLGEDDTEIVIQTSETISCIDNDKSSGDNLPVIEIVTQSSDAIAISPVVENSKELPECIENPSDDSNRTKNSQQKTDIPLKPNQSESTLDVLPLECTPSNQATVTIADISLKTESNIMVNSNVADDKKDSIEDTSKLENSVNDLKAKDLTNEIIMEVSDEKNLSDDVLLETDLKTNNDDNTLHPELNSIVSMSVNDDKNNLISSNAVLSSDIVTPGSDDVEEMHPKDNDSIQKVKPKEKSEEDCPIKSESVITSTPVKLSSSEVSAHLSRSDVKDAAKPEIVDSVIDGQNMSESENKLLEIPNVIEETCETEALSIHSDVEISSIGKSDEQFSSSDSKLKPELKSVSIDSEVKAFTLNDSDISPAPLSSLNDVDDASFDDSKSKIESQSSMESDDDPDDDDFVRGEPVTGDSEIAWVNSVDDSTCGEELSNEERREPDENTVLKTGDSPASSDRSKVTVNTDIQEIKLPESDTVTKTDTEPIQRALPDYTEILAVTAILENKDISEPTQSQEIESSQFKTVKKIASPEKSALSTGESQNIVALDVKMSKDIERSSPGNSGLLKDSVEMECRSLDSPVTVTDESKKSVTFAAAKFQESGKIVNKEINITKAQTHNRPKESIDTSTIPPTAPNIPLQPSHTTGDNKSNRPTEKKTINILENNNESLTNKCNRDLIKKGSRNDKLESTKKAMDKNNSISLFEDCAESFSEQNKSDEALTPIAIAKSPKKTIANTSVPCLSPRISPKNTINIIADIAIPTPRIVDVPIDNAVHLYSSSGMRASTAKTYLQHSRSAETKKTFNNDHSTPVSHKYDYSMSEFGKNQPQKPKLSTYWNNQHNSSRTAHEAKLQHPKSYPVKTYSSSQKLTNKIIPIPEKKKEPVTLYIKDDGIETSSSTNRLLNQAAAFSNTTKRVIPAYNSPLKSSAAHISPKEDFTENVIGIQQYIGTASDVNVDSDVIIYSAEDTASSADESINSEQSTKSKSRQPRKQVFTPVTRSDMEIIFPNLYTAEKEASKQPKSARLPYKPRGRGCNAESLKGQKKELAKDKAVSKDSHLLKDDNTVVDITSSKDRNTPKDVSKVSEVSKNSVVIKVSNPSRSPIGAINVQENDIVENISPDRPLISKHTSDVSDLNDSCLAKENLTQNICTAKDKNAQTPENKVSTDSPCSERRDNPAASPLSSSAKRKRGRPKKITSSVPQTSVAETVSPNTSSKSETEHATDELKSDDPSDNAASRINSLSPFGKINENIVCPICFKTFRTENVLLKHVKHCNGAIDKEALKSPKRRKIAFDTVPGTDEVSETVSTSPLQSPSEQPNEPSVSVGLKIEQAPCKEESKIELKKEEKLSVDKLLTESIQRQKSPIPLQREKKHIDRLVEVTSVKATETDSSQIIVIDDSFSVSTEPTVATPLAKASIEHKEILVDEFLPEKKFATSELSSIPLEENVKKKADSKSHDIIQLHEKLDPDNGVQEIGKNCISKPAREKMVGGGRKLNEIRAAASSTLSPMSRLSKILKTKPPVNNSISCEICGKTFRQLAHMVYHRDKHNADDVAPAAEKSKIPVGAPKVKTNLEPESTTEQDAMLKCEICQKGFRKLHHLVEHRETHSGEVKSRRTSAASVKSEPEAGFRCDACDKSFRKLHHLVEHRELHAAEASESASKLAAEAKANDDATCAGCGKSFRKRHHMVEHRDIHCSPSKKGRSDDAEPSDDNDVRLSVGSSASDDSNSCKICGKSYRKLHHMVEHRESHQETPSRREEKMSPETDFMNTKDIIHECAKCYMVFPNENSLNKHATLCLRKRILSRMKSMQPDIPEEAPPADANGRVLSRSKSLIPHFNESIEAVVPDELTPSPAVTPQAVESVPAETIKKPAVKSKIPKPSPPPKKQPKRESEPKISKEDSTVKYKINDESEIKYKINPAFVKPGKRLSQSSDTAKSPVVKPKIKKQSEVPPAKLNKRLSQTLETKPAILKAKTRRISESALSGLKIPSSKMLKTIYEECSIRYSFPPKSPKVKDKAVGIDKSAKESEKKSNNTKRIIPPPKKPVKQNAKIVSKNTLSNKKAATLVVTKRKSIGGRKSIDGKMLPTGNKKLQLKCCKQTFSSQATLADHRKTHKVRQTHKCDCGQSFEGEILLKRHIDTEHTPPKSFKCADCGTSVRTASQFLKHKKEHEASQKTALQRKSAGKASNPTKKAVATAKEAVVKAKSPELGAKKTVKRKLAHGGVPLSDKMKKAIAGGKF